MAQPESLALPPSARLVHIGPHKTGTTAVQSAFHTHRSRLRHHGVHYAGSGRQPAAAALAVAGGSGARGDRAPQAGDWTRLLDEVRRAGQQRVVVSSEYFSHADDEAARQVIRDLEGGPVHVVVTLRPLTLIAPSQWQQFIQNGRGVSFDRWLARAFPEPPSAHKEELFWHRHSHGQLVSRWADAVGPQNLTVVVTAGGAPDALMRSFEAMLALPEGLLEAEQSSANRSLSRGEVELVRHINRGFRKHDWSGAWSNEAYDRLVYQGAVLQMKTGRRPAPDEPRVQMPDWVMDRVCRAGREAAEIIATRGVRVLGDLSALSQPVGSSEPAGDSKHRSWVRADAAALAVLGAMAPRERDGAAARRLAALCLLEAIGAEGHEVDPSRMPLLPAAKAARAVLAVIGGGGSASLARDGELVAADLAERAVLGACGAAGRAPGADLTPVRPVLEALGVDVEAPTDIAQGTQITGAAIPVDKKTVENATTRQLVEVVTQRVTRRVRLRWRHGRGGSSSRTWSKR